MKKQFSVIIIAFIFLSGFSKSYLTSWSKYLLADIYMGGDIEYYKRHAENGDHNSLKAIDWYNKGIQVINLSDFERITVNDGVVRIVIKGSNQTITGKEIRLSDENLYSPSRVRYIIADIALGASKEKYSAMLPDADISYAFELMNDTVTVSNTYEFSRVFNGKEWELCYFGTGIKADGNRVLLSCDEECYETDARYMYLDMVLGAPIDYYSESYRLSRDPNIKRALQLWDEKIKILNLWQFERKIYPGNKVIVEYKGLGKKADGYNIELATDRFIDSERKYIMADIALGAPVEFYLADKNRKNDPLFNWLSDGVWVVNACEFERYRFPDRGMTILKKGTNDRITGEEVILSSDLQNSEGKIRYIMADLSLGGDISDYSAFPLISIASIASERLKNGVLIYNLDRFERLKIKDNSYSVMDKKTGKIADGMHVGLNTDTYYNEDNVRLLTTALYLGFS
ncbi:MAG: hypothetical protein HC906_08155 [Bacteroidales bacterium]|nr:hypothetical protein [Bacteroidales bacterium]